MRWVATRCNGDLLVMSRKIAPLSLDIIKRFFMYVWHLYSTMGAKEGRKNSDENLDERGWNSPFFTGIIARIFSYALNYACPSWIQSISENKRAALNVLILLRASACILTIDNRFHNFWYETVELLYYLIVHLADLFKNSCRVYFRKINRKMKTVL